MIGFTKTVCFLSDVHAFEFMVVQQMIATVLEFVDSIEFKVAEWTHPGFIRTDSDQFFQGEQCIRHSKILSNWNASETANLSQAYTPDCMEPRQTFFDASHAIHFDVTSAV